MRQPSKHPGWLAIVLCASALGIAGCVTDGHAGSTWWNPMTWGSHSEASAVDLAETRVASARDDEDAARKEVLEAARDEVHRTGAALDLVVTPDPAVLMARRTNSSAAGLLDQAIGAPAPEAMRQMREWAATILSNPPEAEKAQRAVEDRESGLSAALEASRKALEEQVRRLDEMNSRLREAFDRENALANTLRNERMIKWGVAGLAVLGALGWLYLKISTGGLVDGVGAALNDLRSSGAAGYNAFINALDVNLTPALQAKIAAAKLKAARAAAAEAAAKDVTSSTVTPA